MAMFTSDINKSIVQIGKCDPIDTQSGPMTLGTGVILNWSTRTYVITAKHVIDKIKKPSIFINSKTENIFIGKNTVRSEWISHKNDSVDLVGISLDFYDNVDALAIDDKNFLFFDDVNAGEDIFYLGFPFNLTPEERLIPVFRKGCIAQKFPSKIEITITENKKISFTEKQMIIDAHVSKGNSGCPVFTSPRLIVTKNRKSTGPYLIGIVRGHIGSPIKDTYGLSEHSGLGEIYSTDIIVELLKQMAGE